MKREKNGQPWGEEEEEREESKTNQASTIIS